MKLNKITAYYCAFLAAALYAVSSPIAKILLDKIPAAAMAGFLYLGAGIGLTILKVFQRNKKEKLGSEEGLLKSDLPYVIGMITLDIIAPILLMYGLKFATAANVSLLNNFEIVATSLIAYIFFKEKISKRLWIGIIFVTLASIILSIESSDSFKFSMGSLFVIGACICWGMENNCTKQLSNKNPINIVQIKGFFSGCGSLIISFVIGERITINMLVFVLYATILGFFSYGLSIMLYIYAQRKLGAAKTSTYYASAPFIGAALSFLIFKEMPSRLFVAALIIMIIGTYYASNDENHTHNKFHSHDGVYSIDYYSYISKIRNWNPSYKVFMAFSILLLCIIADNIYVSLAIIITMGIITVFIGGISLHQYVSLLKIPVAFMIMGSIAIAAGISVTPYGQYNLNCYWFYLYTSDESIIKTLNIILKAFGAVSAMYMLTLSTPACEIISVLKKMHMPKIIIELMNMIYRFIFIMMDVQCKMKNSAQSRLGYVDFKTSCYSFGSMAGNLLIVSLKKANAYYDAMESRCYNGEMMFLEEEKHIPKKQIIYLIIYFAFIFFIWVLTK